MLKNYNFCLQEKLKEDDYRKYGFFHCKSCNNRWESGNAYQTWGQKCQKCCNTEWVRPYRVVSNVPDIHNVLHRAFSALVWLCAIRSKDPSNISKPVWIKLEWDNGAKELQLLSAAKFGKGRSWSIWQQKASSGVFVPKMSIRDNLQECLLRWRWRTSSVKQEFMMLSKIPWELRNKRVDDL